MLYWMVDRKNGLIKEETPQEGGEPFHHCRFLSPRWIGKNAAVGDFQPTQGGLWG